MDSDVGVGTHQLVPGLVRVLALALSLSQVGAAKGLVHVTMSTGTEMTGLVLVLVRDVEQAMFISTRDMPVIV